MANFTAAYLDGLDRIIKRKLKKSRTGLPNRRLPGRDRPDNPTLVTACTTS
jgi:hypothetical protein